MMNPSGLHVINLDRSPERLARFRRWNEHLGEVKRYGAADGDRLDRATLIEEGVIAPDFCCGAGSLGCAISHIRLWQMCVREGTDLTIFEDDAIVARDFMSAARRAVDDLPHDWELIKWGFSGNMPAWFEIGLAPAQVKWTWADMRRDEESLRAFQAGPVSCAPVRMLNSVGLFAYSISPRGARAALDACLPLANRTATLFDGETLSASGIDALLSVAMPGLSAFASFPSIALHADGGSSIRMELDRE